MGPVEDLVRRARARITDPVHWTQGRLAQDNAGKYVDPSSPEAMCWCHNGAYVAEGAFRVPEAGIFSGQPLEQVISNRQLRRLRRCVKVAFTRTRPRERHEIVINNFHNKRMAHAAVLRLMDRTAEYAAERGW